MVEKIKPFLLILAVGFSAFQTGRFVPDMQTVSLSSWIYMVLAISPGILLVMLVALWRPSGQTICLEMFRLPPAGTIFSKRNLLFLLPLLLICGLGVTWLITYFRPYIFISQLVLLVPMFLMLVLGMFKPHLAPAAFFAFYPFLMFSEARLPFAWNRLGLMIPNAPEWLLTTLFSLENINVVLLVFTVGFIYFFIRHANEIGNTMLDKPIYMFLIWTGASVITADNSLVGLRFYFVKWVFPVAVYYATFLALKRTRGTREIKLALTVLLFFSCLLTIKHAALMDDISFDTGERVKVWTIIAGQMGPWTILILPLTLSMFFDRKELFYIRIFCALTVVSSIFMALWEMQRVVILDLSFMLGLSFLLYHKRWRWHMLVCSLAGIAGYFAFDWIIGIVEMVRPSMIQENPFALTSNAARLFLYEEGWDIIKNNPVVGIGPGGFQLLHIMWGSVIEVSSHNIFIDVALESGIPALILYITIILTPVVKFAASFLKGGCQGYDHDLRPWIISTATFLGVHHMFHTNWVWGYGAVAFCMLGVIIGTMRNAASRTHVPVNSGVND